MNLVSSVKGILLTYCVFITGVVSLRAQTSPLSQITIASPTAASLGKYADIPVSYHTGIPDINIPIYTIKEGTLTVPISMSYYGGGLKVMEPSSPVGAGWALNAGGVITRTVRGGADDRGLLAAHTKYGYFHDYGYMNYLLDPNATNCYGYPCPFDPEFATQVRDGEPDLYFFNFNGYTGKFYFNDDRTPVLVPQQDLKIEPILADESSSPAFISMLGFIITTPDGTRYYFGKNQEADGSMNAIEVTYNMTTHVLGNATQDAVSSWFLTKISSADDQFSIKFLYQPDKYSLYMLSMFPIWNTNGGGFGNSNGSNNEYDLAKNFIDGVKLRQIVFTNGTINFDNGMLRSDVNDFYFKAITDQPNHEATSLGSISINGPDNFCKKFTFSQSYFVDNSTPNNGYYASNYPVQTDTYRLRLDAIQEQSCDGSIIIPPYRFTYYDDGGTNFAPRRLGFGVDHWGFYNGIVSNQGLVPTYWENNVKKDGADRDSHWPAMRNGALKRITYPMGGYTDLEFEPNNTYGTIFSKVATGVYQRGVGNTATNTRDEITTTFSGNLHQVIMSNDPDPTGGVANIEIENSNHNIVFTLPVNPGESKTGYFTEPPGTFKVTLYKSTPAASSGHGASATITEIATTSTTANIMVGGLRIKTITKHDDFTNNDVVTNYNYTVTGGTASSGILYSRPVYVSLIRNDIVKKIGSDQLTGSCSTNGCLYCDASTGQSYYKSGGEIFPMVSTQGNHIGYNDVKVSQTGNGYSIYRYYTSGMWTNINSDIVTRSVNNTACDVAAPNFPAAPIPFDYKRGDLKYEGHFTEAGKAVDESYHYPQYEISKIKTPGYIASYIATVGGLNVLWGTEYELQTYRKVSQEVISYKTDPATGKSISNTTREYYGSAFHNMATRTEQETSTGGTLVTTKKYAMDFRLSNCDMDDGWSTYLAADNNAALTFSNSLNCTPTVVNCRWVAYQKFRLDRSIARKNYLSYRRTNFTDPGNTFSVNHANAKNVADAVLKPILELQDEYKNEPVEVSTFRDNRLIRSAYTGFGFAANPSNKVYPVKTRLINVYDPITGFTAAATSSNNQSVVADSRYLDEAAYTFSKGNLAEGTPKSGVTTAYLWGYPNNAAIARVTNAHNNEVAYTSFENGEQEGNWTISDNSRNAANKITGRKSYDLSGGKFISTNIPAGKQYVVSYWSMSGAATVSANGVPVTAAPASLSKGGWTFYEHTLPNTATAVVVTGNGVTIDELKLYPVDAEMETWCYTPVLGITSSCDKNNRLAYYEYDALGRLMLVRDQDGNIVKTYKYNYKQ